jgi:uncharacterized protein YaeQ
MHQAGYKDKGKRQKGTSFRGFCSVALSSTIYNFDIDLSDSDRSVYESLPLRVARHPSESEEYLVTRVLAYALAWIDIGTPDAARLHKASKLSPRVAVYTHKDVAQLLRNLHGERIHRAQEVEIHAIDRSFIALVAARLERRMAFSLSIHDRELYLSIGADTVTGAVVRHAIAA